MATTSTRKLIYCLQEANFTQSLFMTVAHEYWTTFSTKKHVLARSVGQSKSVILLKWCLLKMMVAPSGRSSGLFIVRSRLELLGLVGRSLVRRLLLQWRFQPLLGRSLLFQCHVLHPPRSIRQAPQLQTEPVGLILFVRWKVYGS